MHTPADTDFVHDTRDDVTEARRPNTGEREVLDLLDLDPERRPWVRLTLAAWARVDAVAARLEEARGGQRPFVPAPRIAAETAVTV